MKLIRKNTSAIYKDKYGVEHPNLTLSIKTINEDKLNKKLKFTCYYYHTNECDYEPLMYLDEVVFNFSNQYVNDGIGNYGWPTYSEVKEDIEIDENGNLIPLNQDMGNWILNQSFITDINDKKFIEDWLLID